MLKVLVLVSGRGSNMVSLVEASRLPGYPFRIVAVISNEVEAPALDRARALGIPVETIQHRSYASRESFERAIDQKAQDYGADIICLAGFMRILSPWFIERWQDKIVNIHPSLLPAFPGLNTHEKAIECGVKFSGCTVHFAHIEMDRGPIIAQAVVPVLPKDTPDVLAARVLEAEHKLFPLALRLIAEGRVHVVGENIIILGAVSPTTFLISPLDDLTLAKTKVAQ